MSFLPILWFEVVVLLMQAQAVPTVKYVDPKNRFEFTYPTTFGATSAGANDGFGDRVAAVRFKNLSGLGGEAALTKGFPVIDLQAVGGLYDSITLEILPSALRNSVIQVLGPITPETFCDELAFTRTWTPRKRRSSASPLRRRRR